MALLRSLYAKLHLTLNETKCAVASVFGRKFLGYSLWVAKGKVVKLMVAKKAVLAFKQRVREVTLRSGGRSMAEVVERLRVYLLGWKACFGLAHTPGVWLRLDEWTRYRLRAIQLKHWKRGRNHVPRIAGAGGKRGCGGTGGVTAIDCLKPP